MTERSWRAFRESTAKEATSATPGSVVVQTDISGFYEHISHHYIENCINDLFPDDGRIAFQIVALLCKFSVGRSYGLPVGGQGSRILAELLLSQVDRRMTAAGISWHRYVDDYILIAGSNADAYKALSTLAHTLADYGLALNRTKTIFLSVKHYTDYVNTQLGLNDSEAGKLREIDLHFDPYSDTPVADYESLKQAVAELDVKKLLDRELEKALPDTFLVTQIGRTLRLHDPVVAIQLVTTLLAQQTFTPFGHHGQQSCVGSQTFAPLMTSLKFLFPLMSCLIESQTIRYTFCKQKPVFFITCARCGFDPPQPEPRSFIERIARRNLTP